MRGRILAAASGTFLLAFGLLGLSGPGRIDIVDGQTRFEVARSLVEHGDAAIRDPRVRFGVFPGRGGVDYTTYRLPQSVLGVFAILASDATGNRSEERRHFFFVLTSTLAGATLAAAYFIWFVDRGLTQKQALGWAAGGIFATPVWFYSTSTFDDILGTAAVVVALAWAHRSARNESVAAAIGPALLVALAFHCKQPLAIFLLPVATLLDRPDWSVPRRIARLAILLSGLTAGLVTHWAYDAYKFPPESRLLHAPLLAQYTPVWPGHPVQAVLALTLSPSAGLAWYGPAVLLALRGMLRVHDRTRVMCLVAIIGFSGFIASLSFFKGDPAWGPRYFLPVYGVLWLWVPDGVHGLDRSVVRATLIASVLVQLVSLPVDPHRLYVERSLPSAFGAVAPLAYFDPSNAHLLQRPRELHEMWKARHSPGIDFSPSPGITFAFPVLDTLEQRGPEAVQRYIVLNAFRPWWIAFSYLGASSRPVPLLQGLLSFGALALVGAVLVWASWPVQQLE